MPVVDRPGDCLICENYTPAIHMHHTIPRSLGGEDSLQIPLCGDCHTVLHANASAVVANIQSGGKTKIKKAFWDTERKRHNAAPFLEILIRAMLCPPEDTEKLTLLPMLRVGPEIHQGMKLLKADTGLGSLEATLLYCIQYTLFNRGLMSHGKERKEKTNSSVATSLWGVQRSKS